MKFKSSLYNYTEMCENGDWLIYNFLSQNKIKIESHMIKQYGSYLKDNNPYDLKLEDKNLLTLIEQEFIISDEKDEIKLAQMKHNEIIYGTDTLRVQIIPTTDCNLRCVYCFENPEQLYMDQETEDRVLKFIDRKLKNCRQLRFAWFGGEPLLCKEQVVRMSKKINDLCQKNKVAMFGEISTNGYLLDQQTFQSLVSNGIYEYQICLDGPEKQHNITRPHYENPDSFQLILNNLLQIQKASFHNFSVGIRCNITPQVEPFLEEYLILLSKYFKGDSRFKIVLQGVRDWGGDRVLDTLIPESESNLYMKWYARATELGLASAEQFSFAPFVGYCEANRRNGYVIRYDGTLHKCNIAMFDPEYQSVNQIGKIEKTGKAVIAESNIAQWIVPSDIPRSKCQTCVMYPFCMEGHCFFKLHIKKEWSCNRYLLSIVKSYLKSLNHNGIIKTLT